MMTANGKQPLIPTLAIICFALWLTTLTSGSSVENLPNEIVPLPQNSQSWGVPHSKDSISIRNKGGATVTIEAGVPHRNTFEVEEYHAPLGGNRTGATFNVETVPAALPNHKSAPTYNYTSIKTKLQSITAMQYNLERRNLEHSIRIRDENRCISPTKDLHEEDIRLEAMSEMPSNLVYVGGNGFLVACVTAFSQHLPLELSPDHVWSLVTYAFAKHVDENAEELRSKFVRHEGKRRILVETPAWFPMSGSDNGATADEWESHIFSVFSEQIKEQIGEKTHQTISADFSTSTPGSRAASQVALMSATKSYFSFGLRTSCGIPRITLSGTDEDWVALRNRTQELGQLMTPKFAAYWIPLLLPLLDEFVESYRGNVNHGFWQSMVKLRHNGMASGYREFISGWVQILFPYLTGDELNTGLHSWNESYFSGPEPEQFPSTVSSVPVDWNYNGQMFDMDFFAGANGVSQNPQDGGLKPEIGWYVTHSPRMSDSLRLEVVEAEIKELLLGHEGESDVNCSAPWSARVERLRKEAASLEKKSMTCKNEAIE